MTIPVIDVDTHLTEPHDLWTSRAPEGWRDRVPQVRRVDGRERWVVDGTEQMGSTRAASVIMPDGSKSHGARALSLRLKHVHPSSYDVTERVAMMDTLGIQAQIGYPNLLGFGGHKLPNVDPALKTLCATIYNDAMGEFQDASGQRVFPMALLPWWDIDAAVAEARRAHGLGLRGVNLNPDPHQQGFPDLGTDHWHPLWEVCEELELPVNFHIGSSNDQLTWFGDSPWPSQTDDHKLAIGGAVLHMTNARVLANLLLCGVCERFPHLKFVSVESGIGWIPFILEALDYHAEEISPDADRKLTRLPSEYFRRQFYGCFWFEQRNLAAIIEAVGAGNVMFETDFPHATCLYPNPVERVMDALAPLSSSDRERVLHGNAGRVYRIPTS